MPNSIKRLEWKAAYPALLIAAVSLTACGDGQTSAGNDPPPEPPSARSCPPPPEYPTPACTGVPPGTVLTELPLNHDGVNHRVTVDGTVIDAKHIAGNLLITANDVVITNSRIDGFVLGHYSGVTYSFTITDSEIGSASSCVTQAGIGSARYTARRVLIRGHDDGFRASGPDITIRDSYVKLCGEAESHSDGIQDYPAAQNLVFDHNTIDMCGAWTTDRSQPCSSPGQNAPIFINSQTTQGLGSTDVRITNNLVMGGGYGVYLWPAHGSWIVSGNRVVEGTPEYGPYETNGRCAHVDQWADNTVVTMNTAYQVTGTVRTEPCPD